MTPSRALKHSSVVVALATCAIIAMMVPTTAEAHPEAGYMPVSWAEEEDSPAEQVTILRTASFMNTPVDFRARVGEAAEILNSEIDFEIAVGHVVSDYEIAEVCASRSGIHFGNSPSDEEGGWLGVTWVCSNGDQIVSANVDFDAAERWYNETEEPCAAGVTVLPDGKVCLLGASIHTRSIAVHEFGHFLGFRGPFHAGHFDANSSICESRNPHTMCPLYSAGYADPETPLPHDWHTLQSPYVD